MPAELTMTPRPATARERLIVALDFETSGEALALVDDLGDEVLWYKVGMELFYAEGPRVLARLHERSRRIFLDLKLHDIPNTMAGAFRSLAGHSVGLTTVHVPAGLPALRAIAEAARVLRESGITPPAVLGVTRLTSLPAPDPLRPWDDIVQLAGDCVEAGLDGWIAPAEASGPLRRAHGNAPILVCPGIRLPDGEVGDQVAVGTPEGAVQGGADWIVVGRPITRAKNPKAAASEFVRRMSGG